MPLSTDIATALHLLAHIYDRVKENEKLKLPIRTSDDLDSLISLLEDPLFRNIAVIQDSLVDLNTQLIQHPSILPGDFDINLVGQLEISIPTSLIKSLDINVYQDFYHDNSELDDQRVPVASIIHTSSDENSGQITTSAAVSDGLSNLAITTPTYVKEFQKVIDAAAKGREVITVQLCKPEGNSLGFSVVGLRSKEKGDLGIFLQEIQPSGIAGRDGRLTEGDQILAIDGQPLDSNISHEQAISILQQARGIVEIVVARNNQETNNIVQKDNISEASTIAAGDIDLISQRDNIGNPAISEEESADFFVNPDKKNIPSSSISLSTPLETFATDRCSSALSEVSKSSFDMVINTEWAQVEVINLINDGSGLGFGIIGGKSTGVVVKTILPGGVADRDNRLQSGDHILQIGDVNLRGMGSEQVAAVLRQSGTHVRLVVARPVEPTSPDYQANENCALVVPTKILGDPEELERHLLQKIPGIYSVECDENSTKINDKLNVLEAETEQPHMKPGFIIDVIPNPVPVGLASVTYNTDAKSTSNITPPKIDPNNVNPLPELERFTVELKKDVYGLGITIAGYVCEQEELSGIFIKSISKGSAADLSKKVQVNDRVVEVNNHSLQGYSNHEAVEVLKNTGQTVTLCIERYLRGPKYEQLQQAIAASESKLPQPTSPSVISLPSYPISTDGDTVVGIDYEVEGSCYVENTSSTLFNSDSQPDFDTLLSQMPTSDALCNPMSELTTQLRSAIESKWKQILGAETEIVIAQLKKFTEDGGLGISLEGTVDVENGREVRPHHYIRSILPEGPVGRDGTLRSGDELLEVNGHRLLGINHKNVVTILKELPMHVRIICRRTNSSQIVVCPINTMQHQSTFQTRNVSDDSVETLISMIDRLVKAKSDGSLASTTSTTSMSDDIGHNVKIIKSRSLEPLSELAMWNSESQVIVLKKGDTGLGFSILDYQDPMNCNKTVIVVRSLVPGGVAQTDGQLVPGDRLLFVNDVILENATLNEAVQTLKNVPKGIVRIGVAKPLQISDNILKNHKNNFRENFETISSYGNYNKRRKFYQQRIVNNTETFGYTDIVGNIENKNSVIKSHSL